MQYRANVYIIIIVHRFQRPDFVSMRRLLNSSLDGVASDHAVERQVRKGLRQIMPCAALCVRSRSKGKGWEMYGAPACREKLKDM